MHRVQTCTWQGASNEKEWSGNMIKEKEVALLEHHDSPLNSHADANIATTKKIETNAGNIILHRYCQPSLIMNLRADSGLRAFARRPQREHELLLNIAR